MFPFPPSAESEERANIQSQSTYTTLTKSADGVFDLKVTKQRVMVDGVSYILQEIFGIEHAQDSSQDTTVDDGYIPRSLLFLSRCSFAHEITHCALDWRTPGSVWCACLIPRTPSLCLAGTCASAASVPSSSDFSRTSAPFAGNVSHKAGKPADKKPVVLTRVFLVLF